MKIVSLVLDGFKDQDREVPLSGLDLFTSAQVNGVGKSAVLEGFKLALLGELPGCARTLEDIFRYTTRSRMAVTVMARNGSRQIRAERRFMRDAEPGEKRVILLDHKLYRYEIGDRRLRAALGPVTIGFDAGGFFRLSAARKREWIIEHAPEAARWSKETVRIGLRRACIHVLRRAASQQPSLRASHVRLLEKCMQSNVREVSCPDEKDTVAVIERLLASGLEGWSEDRPAEANLADAAARLKEECRSLKSSIEELTAATHCAKNDPEHSVDLRDEVELCRARLNELRNDRETLQRRMTSGADAQGRKKRLREVEAEIRELKARVPAPAENEIEIIKGLQSQKTDTRPIMKEIDRLSGRLAEMEKIRLLGEMEINGSAGEAEQCRGKLQRISDPDCPLAAGVRCTTDFSTYRQLLSQKIAEMESRIEELRSEIQENAESVNDAKRLRLLRQRFDELETQNRYLDEETERLRAQWMLREEDEKSSLVRLEMLLEESKRLSAELPETDASGHEGLTQQEAEISAQIKQREARLECLCREMGRRETLAEWVRQREALLREQTIAARLCELAGADGLMGLLAGRIAQSIEKETNDLALRVLPGFRLHVDLSPDRECELGWKLDCGKVIPLDTLNAAHFVLFMALFLTVLVNRKAKMNRAPGAPVLRALCIEAEALSPVNLQLLLRALARMKKEQLLDNVLVAHYASLRSAGKLHGFKEHILRPRLDAASRRVSA